MTTLPSLAPAFTVSSKLAKGSIRSKLLAGTLSLVGVNCADSGCTPEDPEAAAVLIASYGQNWVRFHHLEGQDITKALRFADSLLKRGIRFSIDGCSKLGENLPGGLDAFKRECIDGSEKHRALYWSNIERITPLLQHPACFMICLLNEGAHVTTPAKAAAFFKDVAPVIRKINPDLLVSDCPDAHAQPNLKEWIEVGKLYDVALCHYYNDDGNADGRGNNIFDGWNWNAVNAYIEGTGNRGFIQEFGSYKSNPNQASNIAFVYLESARLGYSVCQFSFSSNADGWKGTGFDLFTITNDPLRLKLLLLGSYLAKNRSGLRTTFWGGEIWDATADGGKGNWAWSDRYEAAGDKVIATKHCVQIGSYVWNFNKEAPATWLTKAI